MAGESGMGRFAQKQAAILAAPHKELDRQFDRAVAVDDLRDCSHESGSAVGRIDRTERRLRFDVECDNCHEQLVLVSDQLYWPDPV